MATRSVIDFTFGGEQRPSAKVYRHYDGYPSAVQADFVTFLADVQAETRDTRFGDPTYLAAKFIVWSARQNGKGLDFLGVAPILHNPGDIDYVHTVVCSPGSEPTIFSEPA